MLISIIVPVYNSECFVQKCIDSIFSQTFDEWELLMVDDGSQDNSLRVLNDNMIKDNRISVFHQSNKGPGAARNLGVKHAKGDYCVFVDSDDTIQPNYLEELSKHDEDVVLIDVNQIDNYGNIIKKEYFSDYRNYSKDDLIRFQMTGAIPWGGVRKAVKRELIQTNSILFSTDTIGEEAFYSFLVLYYSKTIGFLDHAVYNYWNRRGSQSDTKHEDPWFMAFSSVASGLINYSVIDDYGDSLNALAISALAVSLNSIAKNNSYYSFKRKAKQYVDKYYKLIDYSKSIDYNHISKRVILVYFLLTKKLYFLVYCLSIFNSFYKNYLKRII